VLKRYIPNYKSKIFDDETYKKLLKVNAQQNIKSLVEQEEDHLMLIGRLI